MHNRYPGVAKPPFARSSQTIEPLLAKRKRKVRPKEMKRGKEKKTPNRKFAACCGDQGHEDAKDKKIKGFRFAQGKTVHP